MTKAEELAERISSAIGDGRLSTGRLLKRESEDCVRGAPTWHVAAPVRPDVLSAFRERSTAARMKSELVGHAGRTTFLIVIYQAETTQHRFLLPLVGCAVFDLIDELPHHGLGLLMHAGLHEPFLEVHLSVPLDLCAGLRRRHHASADHEQVATDHAVMVAHTLSAPFLEPPPSCLAPSTVCVTSVLPPDLMECAPAIQPATHVH